MLRCCTFSCTSTYTSCYARWSSLALHATLHDLHLHFMLRYMFHSHWQLLDANEILYSKVTQLSVKTKTFAYPQLAMEIHTCWTWQLVSTVWHSSGQVVGKTSQRVKNARRRGNGHIGSQRCIRGGYGILTKIACRWGKTHKKQKTQPELDIFHHRQRQNHW